jgi:hypothetical protein
MKSDQWRAGAGHRERIRRVASCATERGAQSTRTRWAGFFLSAVRRRDPGMCCHGTSTNYRVGSADGRLAGGRIILRPRTLNVANNFHVFDVSSGRELYKIANEGGQSLPVCVLTPEAPRHNQERGIIPLVGRMSSLHKGMRCAGRSRYGACFRRSSG